MLSVVVTAPGETRITDIPEPVPGPYQARVRTEAACLCNATDMKLVSGKFPGVERYPLLLGHESAGVVVAVGDRVRGFKVGDRVIGGLLLDPPDPAYASGWGGFSEFTLVGDHGAMFEDGVATPEHGWSEVYEMQRTVPESIPVEAAVLLCTWREVYAGFGDFNLKDGDDIVIFGAGPVGLSFAKLAKMRGMGCVAVVEPNPDKRERAIQMGADIAFSADEAELAALAKRRGRLFDAVIDAVGSEAIINSAMSLIKMGGSICVYGVIDKPALHLDKSRAPYNFNLLVHQWPTRSRESAAHEPLCEWIRKGDLSHTEFITDEFPISRIQDALETVRGGRALKVLLRFPEQ